MRRTKRRPQRSTPELRTRTAWCSRPSTGRSRRGTRQPPPSALHPSRERAGGLVLCLCVPRVVETCCKKCVTYTVAAQQRLSHASKAAVCRARPAQKPRHLDEGCWHDRSAWRPPSASAIAAMTESVRGGGWQLYKRLRQWCGACRTHGGKKSDPMNRHIFLK